MKFYDVLSRYYDVVFPYSEGKKNFLMEEFSDRDKILDMACGSGTYALELDKEGKEVTAVDLDDNMIELLKYKKDSKSELKYMSMDMTHVKDLGENFDGIFCIGNSIVHLPTKDSIEGLINDCYDVLNYGGKLVIQVINYNKIFIENMKALPTIVREEEGLQFQRDYIRLDNGNIEFKGKIKLNDGEEFVNSVELIPLLKEELEKYLKRFKKVTFYGGFDKKEWSEKTLPTVLVAEK